MKSWKQIIFYVIIVAVLFLILYKWPKSVMPTTTTTIQIVGGDQDEHGCIGSAGYIWCASKEKCLRIWEESCEDITP